MSMKVEKGDNIVALFGKHTKDTGSAAVQIAFLTSRVNYLQNHFKSHKKDHHSKRGLICIVSKRRKLLNYIKNKNVAAYIKLIENLNLRR